MLREILKLFVNNFLDFSQSKFIPDYFSIKITNMILMLRGKAVRFRTENATFFAQEGDKILQISDRSRGFFLYGNGIEAREEFIFKSYCLHNIPFHRDDIVFDCGANSGDLFLRLSKLVKADKYYAFEPNPKDFEILKFNTGGGANLYNLALANVDKELDFF